MAAKALHEGSTSPASLDYKVGDRMPRVDAKAKTLGTAQYVNDMYMEGSCMQLSSVHRALIKKIDTLGGYIDEIHC